MSARRRRASGSSKRGGSRSRSTASGQGLGLPANYIDVLAALHAERAEFLLVGAYALAVHGYRRGTADIDLWIRATSANAARVMRALQAFGAPLLGLTETDLADPRTVFQIGVPPERIDVMGSIQGVDFDAAWQRRVDTELVGVPTAVIGFQDLLTNKLAVGRPKDRADAHWLSRNSPRRTK